MKCCGKDVKTPYCPECGSMLRPRTPLHGLLAHCRAIADVQREKSKEHRRWMKAMEEAGKSTGGERVDRFDAAAEKWESWRDALEEVLKNGRAD